MIALKCLRCGRVIEVSDVMRGMEIPCARCGEKLVVDASGKDVDATELGLSSLKRLLQNVVPPGATNPSGGDETLTPAADLSPDASFPFLTSARGPYELGWLAHYQVLRLLGHGGMGYVFEAMDSDLKRIVALKIMKPVLAQDEAARQRFLREARAMAAVKNDHIIAIHHVGQHNHIPFLTMDLLEGESLDKRLEHSGRLPVTEVLRISGEIAQGLAAAHARGLIHRDIKPGNIWLEAPLGRVKLLDFGLARLSGEDSHLTQVGMVMGTPAYMAPEQAENKKIDARCDLFSLGCVLYEMATSEPPFAGSSSMAIMMAVATKNPTPPRQLNPELPVPLVELIAQLLAKDPTHRPASASAVAATLAHIAADSSVKRTPTPAVPCSVPPMAPAPPPSLRRRVTIAMLLVFTLITLAVLAWLAMR